MGAPKTASCERLAPLPGSTGKRATSLSSTCTTTEATGSPSRTAFKYEDDLMVIYAGARHGGLEIVRKKTPDSTIGNPVCMVTPQGVCFRTHGEQIHLVKHIGDLLWERVTPGAK